MTDDPWPFKCPRGHPVNHDNTYRAQNGLLRCRPCNREQRQRQRQRWRKRVGLWKEPS